MTYPSGKSLRNCRESPTVTKFHKLVEREFAIGGMNGAEFDSVPLQALDT